MPEARPVDQRARADRILDTAKDLLFRWGYRRITIADIADRAGVGKGTIYLHWRTREELFVAVGAREAAQMVDAVAEAMRADPFEVALHRYMRRFFTEAMTRPVLRALFTRDTETLGAFLSSPAREPLQGAKLVSAREYLGVLAVNGLLREGLRPEDLDYSLPAVVFGFFGIEPLLSAGPTGSADSAGSAGAELDLQQKADHLAEVLWRTFEPPTDPAKRRFVAAAPKAIETFEHLARGFRQAAYGDSNA